MATCHFCGREFTNRQAVRAHLRTCPAYPGAPKTRPAYSTPEPQARPQADTVKPNRPTRRLTQNVRREWDIWGEMNLPDDEAHWGNDPASPEADFHAAERHQEAHARQDAEQTALRTLRTTMRATVVDTEKEYGWNGRVQNADREAVAGEIVAALLRLPLTPDLDEASALQLARGVRDRVLTRYDQDQATRARTDAERQQQLIAQQARGIRRQNLVHQGRDHAHTFVQREIEGLALDDAERRQCSYRLLVLPSRIADNVRAELDRVLTGDESWSTVRDLAEDLAADGLDEHLEDLGIDPDDGAEEDGGAEDEDTDD